MRSDLGGDDVGDIPPGDIEQGVYAVVRAYCCGKQHLTFPRGEARIGESTFDRGHEREWIGEHPQSSTLVLGEKSTYLSQGYRVTADGSEEWRQHVRRDHDPLVRELREGLTCICPGARLWKDVGRYGFISHVSSACFIERVGIC
jgi:hypothetical protein